MAEAVDIAGGDANAAKPPGFGTSREAVDIVEGGAKGAKPPGFGTSRNPFEFDMT